MQFSPPCGPGTRVVQTLILWVPENSHCKGFKQDWGNWKRQKNQVFRQIGRYISEMIEDSYIVTMED